MLHQNTSQLKFKQKLVNLSEGGEEMRRDTLIVWAVCLIAIFILASFILSITKTRPTLSTVVIIFVCVAMFKRRNA